MTADCLRETSNVLILTAEEAEQTRELAARLADEYSSTDDERLLHDLPLLTPELPLRVRGFLRTYALDEIEGHCVVAGHVIDEERIGPTPEHWKGRTRPGPEFPEEILLLLYAALLGEPFGWSTQQDGHFVNDVFPVREFEQERLGTGSQVQLTMHTEDAFHQYRADYVIFATLRNPDAIPTVIAELDCSELTPDDLETLFEPRFSVIPDTAHLARNNTVRTEADLAYFRALEELTDHPSAVFFGSRTRPFLRFDESQMCAQLDDPEAARAFAALRELLVRERRPCQLDQGAFLFLNNHRVVHGRNPFTARYDGTDRWLKRINVTTDLRKSSDMRGRLGPRLIG
jgi:Fe(II)/alpha-ketoglutarate-dependent arginine beta-hydroxylase